MEEKKLGKPVLVTTEHRGVFFGYLELGEDEGCKDKLVLRNVRCAIYWAGTGGFLSLASDGPNENCRIGDEATRVILHDITSVSDCTDVAAKRWDNW